MSCPCFFKVVTSHFFLKKKTTGGLVEQAKIPLLLLVLRWSDARQLPSLPPFKKKLYLAVSGLSCSTQDVHCGIQTLSLWHTGSVAPQHVGSYSLWDLSSSTGDWTCIPCIARRMLNHWTSREVPLPPILDASHLSQLGSLTPASSVTPFFACTSDMRSSELPGGIHNFRFSKNHYGGFW